MKGKRYLLFLFFFISCSEFTERWKYEYIVQNKEPLKTCDLIRIRANGDTCCALVFSQKKFYDKVVELDKQDKLHTGLDIGMTNVKKVDVYEVYDGFALVAFTTKQNIEIKKLANVSIELTLVKYLCNCEYY